MKRLILRRQPTTKPLIEIIYVAALKSHGRSGRNTEKFYGKFFVQENATMRDCTEIQATLIPSHR